MDNLTLEVPAQETPPVQESFQQPAQDAAQPASSQDTAPDTSSPDIQPPPAVTPERNTAQAELAGKGLDMGAFEQEFTTTGSLSEDSYAKLAAAGIPKELVDSYIAGQEARSAAFLGEIHGVAGGEAQYAEMVRWAKTALSSEDIAAFDTVAVSGDKALIRLAVSGLVSRWRETEGRTPSLIGGNASAGASPSLDVFESPAQVVAAMRDPRYGKDPAYQRLVEAKMARSPIFGGNV